MKKKKQIICTKDRAVFYGELVKNTTKSAIIKNVKMCLYWSSDVGGVLGLAKTGVTAGCRISKEIPKIEIFTGINAVMDMTPEAIKSWENAQAVE